jgi:hypothetical protein
MNILLKFNIKIEIFLILTMNSLCYHFNNMSVNKEQDACCICLDDLENNGIATLECGHTIHLNCFMEFMLCNSRHSNNNKCPLCRTIIQINNNIKNKIDNLSINKLDKSQIMFINDIQHYILIVLKDEPDYSYTPQGIQNLIIEKHHITYEEKDIKKNCNILYEGGRLTFMRGRNGRHMFGYDTEFLNN